MDIAPDDRDVDAFPSLDAGETVSHAFAGDSVALRTVVAFAAEPADVEPVELRPRLPLPVHVVAAASVLPDNRKVLLQAVEVPHFEVYHNVIQEQVQSSEASLERLENELGSLHGKTVVGFQPFDGLASRRNFFDCLVFQSLVGR